jgi:cardiolipin synthase (CMP-forming)
MRPAPDPTFVTTANILSGVRIPMAAALWIAPASAIWVLTLMALAAITDILDGTVARWDQARRAARGLPERAGDRIGPWIDPVCDKAFVVSLAVALFVTLEPRLWVLLATVTREIIMAVGLVAFLLFRPLRQWLFLDFHAGPLRKATTVVQFVTLGAIFLGLAIQEPLAIAAGVTGTVAVTDYVRRARRHRMQVAAETGGG